jgi:hypothetical protein
VRRQEKEECIAARIHQPTDVLQDAIEVGHCGQGELIRGTAVVDQRNRPSPRVELRIEQLTHREHFPFEDGLTAVASEPHEEEPGLIGGRYLQLGQRPLHKLWLASAERLMLRWLRSRGVARPIAMHDGDTDCDQGENRTSEKVRHIRKPKAHAVGSRASKALCAHHQPSRREQILLTSRVGRRCV